mgnify:FL=1
MGNAGTTAVGVIETEAERHERVQITRQRLVREQTASWAGEVVLYTPRESPGSNVPAIILHCADIETFNGQDSPVFSLVHYDHGVRGFTFVERARRGTGIGTWHPSVDSVLRRTISELVEQVKDIEARLKKIE